MKNYLHSQNIHKHTYRFRVLHGFLVFFMALTFVGGISGWYYLRQEAKKEPDIATSADYREVFNGGAQKTVESGTFTFRTRLDWKISTDESLIPQKYVYYSTRNNLVENRLIIYLDNLPEVVPISQVMSVTASENGYMKPDIVSELCRDTLKNTKINHEVTLNEVRFTCLVESNNTIIGAGLIGGTHKIPLEGSNGNRAVIFTIESLATTPSTENFNEILSSFKLK